MVEEEGLEFDILESRRVNCTLMALGQHDRYKNGGDVHFVYLSLGRTRILFVPPRIAEIVFLNGLNSKVPTGVFDMASTSSGKKRTYKEAFLQWRFTSIVDKNIEKPQCVLCNKQPLFLK
ncbi:unnamed protein product [Acanthoscelides obtectus]|uniref:Uncharacterized protein n=1 Tax=Acanthoscelides obtectus TaxID=200917 RepID=A0A9P0LF67_ACAOB|nr:unnamed protein product [Acanthoscelides obtectus]CAK1670134.1 hypothetical protein AOBTE_LOCUS27423 [Acanthoscelides obtectus]